MRRRGDRGYSSMRERRFALGLSATSGRSAPSDVHRRSPTFPASDETEAAVMQPAVTVGLDGSPESLAAARWAADEADKRKLTLRLLHAWPLLAPEPARVPAEVDQNYWAKRLVHTAHPELESGHPGLTIIGSLVADD